MNYYSVELTHTSNYYYSCSCGIPMKRSLQVQSSVAATPRADPTNIRRRPKPRVYGILCGLAIGSAATLLVILWLPLGLFAPAPRAAAPAARPSPPLSGAGRAREVRALANARMLTKRGGESGGLVPLTDAERLRRLELMVESSVGWLPRPHQWITRQCQCPARDRGGMKGFYQPTGTDFMLCTDRLQQLAAGATLPGSDSAAATPKTLRRSSSSAVSDVVRDPSTGTKHKRCLVYDFGIRDMPFWGLHMAKIYGCEVHAFDPSPISRTFFAGKSRATNGVTLMNPSESESEAKSKDDPSSVLAASLVNTGKQLPGRTQHPLYFYHPWGAGGFDGEESFFEYNWGQISIQRPGYRPHPLNHSLIEAHPDVVKLPVRTLASVMKSLGHEGRTLDVLKLDIEGSEYLFLQQIFDTLGCPPFDQLAVEWHHFTHDEAYGTSPELNTMLAFLNACNLRKITPKVVSQRSFDRPSIIRSTLKCKH